MIILAIESTTNICGIAVSKNGILLGETKADIPQKQLTWIMPAIDKLLKQKKIKYTDIDYVAVTNGPGSYTGLRLGIITAKTIAQVLNIPIIAYNTLKVLACSCINFNGIIVPMLDAKKNQIYAGFFNTDGKKIKQISHPRAYYIDELIKEINTVTAKYPLALQLSGTALYKYKEELHKKINIKYKFASGNLWHPKASILVKIAYEDIISGNVKSLNYASLQAFYLREPDIGKKIKIRVERLSRLQTIEQ